MSNKAVPTVRKPSTEDVDQLYKLICESTGGKTKYDACDLRNYLFEIPKAELNGLSIDDPCMEFDYETILKSSEPVIQAVIAELDGELVGYLIYHHFYSPWVGRCFIVSDGFVIERVDKCATFRKLEEEVLGLCRKEGAFFLLYNVAFVESDMLDKEKTKWHKSKQADWCLIRILFDWDDLPGFIKK